MRFNAALYFHNKCVCGIDTTFWESSNYSEELFSNEPAERSIKVSDRAAIVNLMIGLDGYTISKGFLLQFVNVKIYLFGITALTGHESGDVLMLTGVGEVFPFMRIHTLLKALQPYFSDVPIRGWSVCWYRYRYAFESPVSDKKDWQ